MSSSPPKKSPTRQPDRTNCMACATRSNCIVGILVPENLAIASSLVSESTFRSGDEISPEGEMASSVKIIKVGTVFGYRIGKDGRRRPIGIAGRGTAFGMYGCFGRHNQVSGVAVSAGRYCELSIRHLEEKTQWADAFREHLINDCIRSFGLAADWSAAMRLRTLVKQLAYTLLLLSDVQGNPVVQLPTHTALAELLGTTRESIVRGLIVLEGERCIAKLERKKCHVYGDRLLQWLDSALLVQPPNREINEIKSLKAR
ncbi:Crp/Fnr family transcriptional regulator [Polaromonas sp. AER18D-145]|uniref:Crp/Fnr family transcriptional regulator n=1 Tax=Polaromonas sp. AER18D-145 TaxID=1977060 RepID=UPI0011434613|nr:Crp/Fnr family transcriptional regulator [Polaromonas sp. AER18D-145]